MYSRMQPWIRPAVEDLLHQRIDYLTDFQGELRWCQGEVIEVNKYENNPTKVTVCWDPMSNVVAYSKSTESKVTLLQTFWNKDKDRAWRMDIDLLVQPAQDDESDEESEDECESEVDSDSENRSDESSNSDI